MLLAGWFVPFACASSSLDVIASGGAGWAVQFDGENDHVHIQAPESCAGSAKSFHDLSRAFTIEVWFTFTGLINEYQLIAGQGGDHGFRLSRAGLENQLMLVTATFTGNCRDIRFAHSDGTLMDGRWHHAAASYNGSHVSLYYDGQFDGMTDCSSAGKP
eukprot:409217-Prymnesium_polylepis.1